jgi:hypothetical protein
MYKINSTKIEEGTITSNVTYTLKDGTDLTIDVAVFQPLTKEEVLQGIANREISEQHKYDAEIRGAGIKTELDTMVGQKYAMTDGKVNLIK